MLSKRIHNSDAGFAHLNDWGARWWPLLKVPLSRMTSRVWEVTPALQTLLSFVFYGRTQIWLWESLGTPAWRPRVSWRMAGDGTTSPSLGAVPGVDVWMLSTSTDEPRSDLAPCSAGTRRPVCVTEGVQKKAEVELDHSTKILNYRCSLEPLE